MDAPRYRLVVPPPAAAAPFVPDPAQQRVLDHPGGPLLVLAGPGTGKTATLVEAVARRVEAGTPAERVLVLTFSRRAARELRDRLAARLADHAAPPLAWTFHAFCYALLRTPGPEGVVPRLLSAPEQDVVLRDLLRGAEGVGRSWPEPLRAALGTRGLAEEVRALFRRLREVGAEPVDLAIASKVAQRPEWRVLADLFQEYLEVLAWQQAVDYAELVHQAVQHAERRAGGAELWLRYEAVFVDEYQDTDPAQERLLQAIAGGGSDLVVVGDPDQAIYAFRGADVSGLLRFPARFPLPDGRPAPTLALTVSRRCPPKVLAAAQEVARKVPAPGLPVDRLREHRSLRAPADADPGSVEVHTYPSETAEADAIGDLLRREHLERGTPWSQMAVLVRSAKKSIPRLRRILTAAGVPVEVAGDELPLVREPAVAPLLLALRAADTLRRGQGLAPDTVAELLGSPLVAATPAALRRLGRALRAASAADGGAAPSAPSARLLRDAVLDPALLDPLPTTVAAPARQLGALLRSAAAALDSGAGAEAALWAVWEGSGWPRRLSALLAGGGGTARSAERDLDAVVAVFGAVARFAERRGPAPGVQALLDELEAQQIPADTLAERGVGPAAVRLLTAHRSKGLEWDVVVVASVQESSWPDLRERGSLLQPALLPAPGEDELGQPPDRAARLADERRLFYVALTRSRRRLVVTAVDSGAEDGERPSRFLAELGVDVAAPAAPGARRLSLPAVVGELRRLAVDPATDEPVRAAAVARLARLAGARDGAGQPLAPEAHPDRWWGLLAPPVGTEPVRPPDDPVRLSGSQLQRLADCPLRWFLGHEAGADAAPSVQMAFGAVVHAVAREVGEGSTAAELTAAMERVDSVWERLAFEAPWQSRQQRDAARDALARFLVWHAGRQRSCVGVEVDFDVTVPVGAVQVRLRGSVDRLEIDADGQVHVVDFKTGTSQQKAERHPQLATYQLAVRHGGLDEALATALPRPADGYVSGGAELVLLRQPDRTGGPKEVAQPALPADGGWAAELLAEAVRLVAAEHFPAVPGDGCRQCAFQACCPAQSAGRAVVE